MDHPKLFPGMALVPCAVMMDRKHPQSGMMFVPHTDGRWVTAAHLSPFSLEILRYYLDEQRGKVPANPADPDKKGSAQQDVEVYARSLARSIWGQHYAKDSPNWEANADLLGILYQIDNMVTGMCRKPDPEMSGQHPPAAPEIHWNHVDGPLLVCSNGALHWLTVKERLWVHLGLVTIEALDKQYGAALGGAVRHG